MVAKNMDNSFANHMVETLKETLTVDIKPEGVFKGITDTIKGKVYISNDIAAVSAGIFEGGNTSESLTQNADDILKKMIIPVNGALIMPFGEFIHPVSGIPAFHTGIDIAVQDNKEINAVYEGIVAEIGSKPEYGNYIMINHGLGVRTVYAHCSEITVESGQEIKQGQIIAKIKNTSIYTGSHLHFEIVVNNNTIDPLEYIIIE